ncbi:MAG: hypothetical protein EOR51_12180 [Mesorhizobium sp.]|uniref:hypothetical protein n=1 Tax=Mesorhizobium sp. TaxID=1871066 RepID=UPI000FE9EB20|nr:hypothetical protein [Mesorhizobium sp.]RWK79659.1 MAG: hypothetical protein EOR50_05910 [Mesorhizobium sp.]RWK82435.1 MAG: hypothetical protein EOR51_12180 [Mesorhizobium sp.]RWL08746.1 MAG: hypothetical protein EOR55_03370 [Mesorhizobium sp.]
MSQIDDDMNAEQERAFIEWRDLRNKAEATGDMADAHAAGKAFARFHCLFVENSYRPSEKVVPFARPRFDIGGAA